MSSQQQTQALDGDTELGPRQDDGLYRVSDRLPKRVDSALLMTLFGFKRSRFYELLKAGRFDRFLLRPTVGAPAWSGALLEQYFDGVHVAHESHRKSLRVVSRVHSMDTTDKAGK